MTTQEAINAGKEWQVDFGGPMIDPRNPQTNNPMPYGVQIARDTPEEAANYLGSLLPCSDRLTIVVRPVLDWQPCLIVGEVVHAQPGGFPQ